MGAGKSPRGPAGGALFGHYPDNFGLGIVPLMGLAWWDDFLTEDDTTEGRYGEKQWALTVTGTGTTSKLGSTNFLKHEAGLQLLQVTSSGDKAVLHQNTTLEPFDQDPPVGTLFCVKVRHNSSTTGATLWAGFAEDADIPGSGVSTDFIGVRNEGGGNWFGVCRNNTAETTQDLGLSGSTSTGAYRVIGFLTANDGVRFFTVDATDRENPPVVTWFDPITTNHPNEDLTPVIGIQSTAAGTKGMVVDFFSITGRTRRA